MSPGKTQIVQVAFEMLCKTLCLIKPCSGTELTFRQVLYESADGCANPGYFSQVRVSQSSEHSYLDYWDVIFTILLSISLGTSWRYAEWEKRGGESLIKYTVVAAELPVHVSFSNGSSFM